MDTTGSLSFRRSRVDEILCLLFFVPFGILTVVGSPLAIIEMIRRGDHPMAIVAMTVFGLLPLMAFGLIMLWLNLGVDRHVTVSRHEIRVHRWLGGGRIVDISSLVHLVQYDKPAQLVFLPPAGPPLLALDTGNLRGVWLPRSASTSEYPSTISPRRTQPSCVPSIRKTRRSRRKSTNSTASGKAAIGSGESDC